MTDVNTPDLVDALSIPQQRAAVLNTVYRAHANGLSAHDTLVLLDMLGLTDVADDMGGRA